MTDDRPAAAAAVVFVLCVCAVSAQEAPTGTGQVDGIVVDGSGRPLEGVAIRLTRQGSADLVQLTDNQGHYTFASLEAGDYTPAILGDAVRNTFRGAMTVKGGSHIVRHFVVAPTDLPFALTIAAALVYLTFLLLFRYYNVCAPTRALLRAQINNVTARIGLEADRERKAEANELEAQLGRILEQVEEPTPLGEILFWSRGREIASWNRVHEVERQLVAFLVPPSRVLERAQIAEVELRKKPSPESVALADRIRTTVSQVIAVPDPDAAPTLFQQLKQQLAEALTMLYDDGDTRFAGLMEWHNKAMWMVVSALMAIVLLSLVFHHEELFLIGAAGGLMIRMARSLFREDIPTDYGASWTTLFLSPLLGAIAAWFGIAFVEILVTLRLLGPDFAGITWDGPVGALTVAIAFLCGFSERFFTGLLSAVERRVDSDLKGSTGGATATPSKAVTAPAAQGPSTPSQSQAQTSVKVRLAVDDAASLDQGSLRVTVDEVRLPIPADGFVEVPLEVGREHTLAATARLKGAAVRGEVLLTPTLDDDGKPVSLTLA